MSLLPRRRRPPSRADRMRAAAATSAGMAASTAANTVAAAREAATHYTDAAKGAASTYADATRGWAGPKLENARERANSDVKPRVAAAGGKALGAARDAAARRRSAQQIQEGGGTPAAVVVGPEAESVVEQVGSGAATLTDLGKLPDDVQEELTSSSSSRGRTLLLLALGLTAAAAGWRVYSRRRRSDSSWDLPASTAGTTAPAPARTIDLTDETGGTTATSTTSMTASRTATIVSGGAATSPGGPVTTSDDAERRDALPGDPTRVDATAASTTPASLRSDEGPGVSDTDDAALRSRAGDAGTEPFERVTRTDDQRT